MKTIDPNVREIIAEYMKDELLIHSGMEAIVLCGSQATGTATEHSDIDLCYMGQFPEFKREFRFFKDYELQLMIAPWEWYKEVLNSYERRNNVGTITSMLANGVCLWSKHRNKWVELHDEALKYYIMGPTPASHEELTRIRRKITELWGSYIDAENELTSTWIKNQILQDCVEAHFVINHWWAVKPKYQMEVLRRKDPLMISYLHGCLNMTSESKALKVLCDYVLYPLGGLLKTKAEG